MDDLTYSSLVTIADAIRAREVSSSEVLEAHLARIDEVNGDLNAVVQLCAERAREEATAADAAIARGDELGPCMASRSRSRTPTTPPASSAPAARSAARTSCPRPTRP